MKYAAKKRLGKGIQNSFSGKRKNTFANTGNDMKGLIFKSLGMFGGIPMLVIIIYVFVKWNKIENWLKRIFNYSSDYYKGSVSELPYDKDYYLEIRNNLYEEMDGINILDTGLISIISNLSNYELQYVTDLYNSFYPSKTLVTRIKEEFNILEVSTFPGKASQLKYLEERFNEANIPF